MNFIKPLVAFCILGSATNSFADPKQYYYVDHKNNIFAKGVTDGGLTELYPSAELQRVAKVGREALSTKEIGETASGKLRSGLFYRGYRINRLPEPLNKLGIPQDAVITHVNSQPVFKAAKILEILEAEAKPGARILVEFAFRGQSQVMEYRLQQ